jgi:hypothetical protein
LSFAPNRVKLQPLHYVSHFHSLLNSVSRRWLLWPTKVFVIAVRGFGAILADHPPMTVATFSSDFAPEWVPAGHVDDNPIALLKLDHRIDPY